MEIGRLIHSDAPLSNQLVQNAVASVSLPIYGAETKDILMERIEGYPNDPIIMDFGPGDYEGLRGSEPPPRLPSTLPLPGNLHLQLQLGECLGAGQSGILYEVSIHLDGSSPGVASLLIPPLVAKVSQRYRNEDLEHEMDNYEEMESLQGVVIPRCYGLFEGKVPRTHTILPPGEPRDTEDPRGLNGVICVLLLERLGERLPIGESLPEGILDEVLEMYSELAQLGVDHVDIRHANILHAPQCPPGLPGLPSPYTGKTYRWRLIDFGNSHKTNRDLELFHSYYYDYVERLFRLLPTGWVIEPWEL